MIRHSTVAMVAAVAWASAASAQAPETLLTVAERTDYRATATHREVADLLEALAAESDLARMTSIGRTVEGKPIPVLILSDPPVSTPIQAFNSGKLRLFAFGAIHAGEVCGKEALLQLAREIVLSDDESTNRALLENAVVLIAPIYNGDGNDRMAVGNRRGQNGPEQGMGERPNSMGLDLNRDYVKLESPEARAMIGFLNAWDPHVIIDTHTTNGSYHEFTLTYETPLNPSGHEGPIDFNRSVYMPEVSRRVEARTGYRTFFYGNFNRDRTAWYTYDPRPRFGGSYAGLRNRIGILTEAYSYAPFRDRVLATKAFVRESIDFAVENKDVIEVLIENADAETIARGQAAEETDLVGLRHDYSAAEEPVVIPGFVEEEGENGRPRPTAERLSRTVTHFGTFEPTLSVRRPLGYLVPVDCTEAIENLRRHGIEVGAAAPGETLAIERTIISAVQRDDRPFQGHRAVTIEGEQVADQIAVGDGWIYVSTAQPLGNLVVYLLEPESADGLATWNLFDRWLSVGESFPVLRVLPD